MILFLKAQWLTSYLLFLLPTIVSNFRMHIKKSIRFQTIFPKIKRDFFFFLIKNLRGKTDQWLIYLCYTFKTINMNLKTMTASSCRQWHAYLSPPPVHHRTIGVDSATTMIDSYQYYKLPFILPQNATKSQLYVQ